MDNIFIPKVSNPSSFAPSSATKSAQEARQELLQHIHEYNTDKNTPSDLKIHVTGLTLEEGAIFERDPSLATEDSGSHTPTRSPPGSPSLSPDVVFDTDIIPSKAPESLPIEPELEAPKSIEELTRWRERKTRLRDLQRERETLEMEGRRRTAKAQVDTRWQERALKEWKENKAEINYFFARGADDRDQAIITGVQYPSNVSGSGGLSHEEREDERIDYNLGRGEDVPQEVVIDRDVGNSQNGRQIREDIPKEEKKISPKAPTGLKQLAKSRRKANKEWIAKQGLGLAARENDENTRNNLLRGVTRAIAVTEGVAWKGAEQSIDFVDGDEVWSNTTDVENKGTHKNSKTRVEYPLAYRRRGDAPHLPARLKPESKLLHGKRYGNGSPESEERGRRRVRHTRDSSSQSQATERHAHHHYVGANTVDLPESHQQERHAVEDSQNSTKKSSPPQPSQFNQRNESPNIAVKGEVPKPNFRKVQAAEEQVFVNRPGKNLPITPITPMAPLVLKVEKAQRKPGSLSIASPSKAIRDSRLLPNESPAQWKIRTQLEKAQVNFEDNKLRYIEEANAVKHVEQGRPVKGILKRDRKGKGKAIAWEHGPTENQGEDDLSLERHAPSFNEKADQEELKKLKEKRQKKNGKSRCLATEAKIEKENLAARERAEELAETLMRGRGGSDDLREAEEK